MGTPHPPEAALLFTGTLYNAPEIFEKAKKVLRENFGEILHISPAMPWDYSNYYKDELGWPLYRSFIFFKNIIDPVTIADIKLKAIEIERYFSRNDRRQINLDPGYLTLSKVVLTSTKNYAHRIYLGKGIYGEVTLIYRDKTYNPHLYTYRDYKDNINIFMKVRGFLKNLIHR